MNSLYVTSFLDELELICLLITISIVSMHLDIFNYCYLTLMILFSINHLFADSEVVTCIVI